MTPAVCETFPTRIGDEDFIVEFIAHIDGPYLMLDLAFWSPDGREVKPPELDRRAIVCLCQEAASFRQPH